jgi:rhodanese-related sulfurtransferase
MQGDEQIEISAQELTPLLTDAHRPFTLVDCRERFELGRGILPGAVVMPMSEMQSRIAELDRDRPVIVYCEHGVRSMNVAAYLTSLGMRARSLAGGFADWTGPREPAKS